MSQPSSPRVSSRLAYKVCFPLTICCPASRINNTVVIYICIFNYNILFIHLFPTYSVLDIFINQIMLKRTIQGFTLQAIINRLRFCIHLHQYNVHLLDRGISHNYYLI